MAALLVLALPACRNRHVNGSGYNPPPECATNQYVVVNNGTPRTYDIYIGNQVVGTADPNRTTRFLLDEKYGPRPALNLREVESRPPDVRSPRLGVGAIRVVCE